MQNSSANATTKTMSEKLATFRRLFPGRVDKVIKALRVVEHCSKSHCEFDPELVTKCWT